MSDEKPRVAILVTDYFEEAEMVEPRKFLDEHGAKTLLIAPSKTEEKGKVRAMKHADKAGTYPVDQSLEESRPENFDALLLPGGAMNADALRVNTQAQDFVREFERTGKPMAVICHAPWLLVSAGLVQGRKMTSYHTIQDDLRNAGARWEDSAAVRDRNLLTSRQPSDIPKFNEEMKELFWPRASKSQTASGY